MGWMMDRYVFFGGFQVLQLDGGSFAPSSSTYCKLTSERVSNYVFQCNFESLYWIFMDFL